jgi:hypothetical protein
VELVNSSLLVVLKSRTPSVRIAWNVPILKLLY